MTFNHGSLFVLLISILAPVFQGMGQCYPNQIVTATFATGGSSPYKDQVLWLTWGSTNQQFYPYGRHDRSLSVGSKSYGSVDLANGNYLCVEAEIKSVTRGTIKSYGPGNYLGDSMDKLYNIGGIGEDNQLIAGIVTGDSGENPVLRISAKAHILFSDQTTQPIHLPGLVLADAESLSPREHIYLTARGEWSVADVRKNLSERDPYDVSKRNLPNGNQQIRFERGNDQNTGAVAFLKFDPEAYASENNGFEVSFEADLKGDGLQALAIGLVPGGADLGDAPESYGNPGHLLNEMAIQDDGIIPNHLVSQSGRPDKWVRVGQNYNNGTENIVNINRSAYQPGGLEFAGDNGKYLGTTAPDVDFETRYSEDAKGDDNTGIAGPNEEDAWSRPRISERVYAAGRTLEVEIEYHNGEQGDVISGWIDFNRNGTFDPGERVSATITSNAASGSVILEWTIPHDVVPESTYVRLRYFDKREDSTSPTSMVNFGEVEDHRLYILKGAVVNPALQHKTIKK